MLSRALVGVVVALCLALVVNAESCTVAQYGQYRCEVAAAVPTNRGIEVCNYISTTELAWVLQPCAAGTSCQQVGSNFVCAAAPAAACTVGQKRCVTGGRQTCIAGTPATWGPTVPCPAATPVCSEAPTGPTCVSASPSNACTTGAIQCINSSRFRQCSNGVWYGQDCPLGTQCFNENGGINCR